MGKPVGYFFWVEASFFYIFSPMSGSVAFKEKKIHYTLSGKGKTIVLLHGFLESSAIWRHFTRRFSSEFSVLCIDLPGHGRSEVIRDVQSMDLMAEAVNQVLKEMNITSCLMAGHSMGGYVTLAFAEKYPKKLTGFTLFHSHAAADTAEARQNRERTIKIVEQDRQGFIRNFIPDLFDPQNVQGYQAEIAKLQKLAAGTTKEGIIAALEGMKTRPDRRHVLSSAPMPVQFIIGKNDTRIPMQMIMPQTVLPPHSEILLLDGVGHMGFIEAGEVTLLALKHFANRVF
jgi:pimeloyl-ACP methyl ester carboxylesterase